MRLTLGKTSPQKDWSPTMHIKWIKHPTQPELNGTPEHVEADIGRAAIKFAFAEPIKPELAPIGVRWSVVVDELTVTVGLVGKCNRGCGRFLYRGDPQVLIDNPQGYRFQHGGC